MNYKNFEELPIWIDSKEIAKIIYSVIQENNELNRDLRLKGQITGAALSIMNNIAEGFDSGSTKEFIRFLKYSQRSSSEVMSMTYILNEVYGIQEKSKEIYNKALEIRKQIKGFIKYLDNHE